ncbi:GNAT family N-acetyltransferase [Puteibacter caeruleilacunae]|nr:GNAT family N-acetyltransferase [Puteibacter caeruleilacunae]
MELRRLHTEDNSTVIEIWNNAIRSTHHFLAEEDIRILEKKTLVDLLDRINIFGICNSNNQILGFIGLLNSTIEMLFINPDSFGKGIGTRLLNYAVNVEGASKLEVYEVNTKAITLYESFGFKIVSRNPVDEILGKPFPILTMKRLPD